PTASTTSDGRLSLPGAAQPQPTLAQPSSSLPSSSSDMLGSTTAGTSTISSASFSAIVPLGSGAREVAGTSTNSLTSGRYAPAIPKPGFSIVAQYSEFLPWLPGFSP